MAVLSFVAAYFGLMLLALLLPVVSGLAGAAAVWQTKFFWRVVAFYTCRTEEERRGRLIACVIVLIVLVGLYASI